MTAVPDPSTWATNEDVTAAKMTSRIRDVLDFLLNRPAAVMRQATVQSLTSSVWTALTFDVEDLDDDPTGGSGHSTVSNTSRFTAIYPGWYSCSGGASMAANSTGLRACRWAKNGVVTATNGSVAQQVAPSLGEVHLTARTFLVYLDVGDYVELQAIQNSGGALNTFVTAPEQSCAIVRWERNA